MRNKALIIVLLILIITLSIGGVVATRILLPKNFNNVAEYINYYINWLYYKEEETAIPYTFGVSGNTVTISYLTKYGMHMGVVNLTGTYNLIDKNTMVVSNWEPAKATWVGSVPQPKKSWTIKQLNEKNITLKNDEETILLIRS